MKAEILFLEKNPRCYYSTFFLRKNDFYLIHMWTRVDISWLYFLSVFVCDLYKLHRQSIPVLSIISYCDFPVYSSPQKILAQWIPMVVNAGGVLWYFCITTEYSWIYWLHDHSQTNSSELVWNFIRSTQQFGAYFLVCNFKMANNFLVIKK